MPDAAAIRRAFEAPSSPTVGVEEEVMLLHPTTLDLLPQARAVLARTREDASIKGEFPASQLELITPACASVPEAAAALYAARCRLAAAAKGVGRLAVAGAHPFAAAEGALSDGAAHEAMARQFGAIARRQLVAGLHVHVAIRPGARAVAVYNALRSYLPELAAVAANAPFHDGRDSGLASVRPKIAETLPRQGIPPPLADLDELAAALAWAARAGALQQPRQWWWELRPHPLLGTLEVRVCDAQTTVGDTAALAALVHGLCVWLAERHDADDLPPPAPAWRIEENRWAACRDGARAHLADLQTGAPAPLAERVEGLLAAVAPSAQQLGCAPLLARVRDLVAHPAADAHRAVVAECGLLGLVARLADRFLERA